MPIDTDPHIHHYIVCADVFIRRGDRYLVIKRSPLKRYAPNVVAPIGGKVDRGENAYEALIREAAEEAGIQLKKIVLKAVVLEIQPVKDELHDWLVFHFVGEYDAGEVIKTEEGELLWLTAEEIKQSTLFPSVKEIVDQLLDEKDGTVFTTFGYDEGKKRVIERKIFRCEE